MSSQTTNEEILEWTDSQGFTHSMSKKSAVEFLREFFEEWPGGLSEIESSLRTNRASPRFDIELIETPLIATCYVNDVEVISCWYKNRNNVLLINEFLHKTKEILENNNG